METSQWEYMMVNAPEGAPNNEPKFKTFGEAGWELITVVRSPAEYTMLYYFKRLKQELEYVQRTSMGVPIKM